MEIKTLTPCQLEALISSDTFRRMPVLPISTHRALSHIHNPRVEENDVIMIMAYEGEEMVGYLGVLADEIYNERGEGFKCGWLSCLWVNPLVRGKGIAKQLLQTAFTTWDNRILVTEFTPEAKGLYDRSANFNDLRISKGLRCYLRFNLHEVLPKKNESYAKLKLPLQIADTIANVPVALKLSMQASYAKGAERWKEEKSINKAIHLYIAEKQGQSLEQRSARDLNWINKYPWIKEGEPNDESKRYHFSSVDARFKNLFYYLAEGSDFKGFVHITIRNNHIKVPYLYCDNVADVMPLLHKLMLDYKLNMLTVFHKDVIAYLQRKSNPFLYLRPVKRHYMISKKLDANFNNKSILNIQDGDGDCAFT